MKTRSKIEWLVQMITMNIRKGTEEHGFCQHTPRESQIFELGGSDIGTS